MQSSENSQNTEPAILQNSFILTYKNERGTLIQGKQFEIYRRNSIHISTGE